MRHHHKQCTPRPDDREASQPEEGVAHVHHRAITQHHFEILLGHRDKSDDKDVTQREPNNPREPVVGASGQEWRGYLQEAIEPELFQDPGVEHGRTGRRDGIAFGRPTVEREKRNQNPEAEKEQREDIVLHRFGERLRSQVCTQLKEREGVGTALHVEGDEAKQ